MVPQRNPLSSAEAPSRQTLRFRETALASGLVESQQIDAVEQRVRSTIEEKAVDQRSWDKALALECVRKKILTKLNRKLQI